METEACQDKVTCPFKQVIQFNDFRNSKTDTVRFMYRLTKNARDVLSIANKLNEHIERVDNRLFVTCWHFLE